MFDDFGIREVAIAARLNELDEARVAWPYDAGDDVLVITNGSAAVRVHSPEPLAPMTTGLWLADLFQQEVDVTRLFAPIVDYALARVHAGSTILDEKYHRFVEELFPGAVYEAGEDPCDPVRVVLRGEIEAVVMPMRPDEEE